MDKQNQLESLRHSAEHVLHTAMQNLYPKLKKAMGPPTEDGFYFDFDLDEKITEANFPKIEKEMKKLINANIPIIKDEISIDEAKKIFKDNPYKLDWIDRIKKRGEKISVYKIGEKDLDICKGPHVASTGKVKAFKLLSIAGAYWHGDENNKMLTRIYGTAFPTKKELDEYIKQLEEAKKRDHRKLGKELDLFCFSDLVGPGLPLFTPKGTIIKEALQKHIEEICYEYDYGKVMTPHLAKIKLYDISGHADKFSKELFHVTSEQGHDFVMKPVQCPHQTQIYASRPRSYRDLPIRYMESEKQYRAEKTGEVGGLNRVYAITVEDGHSFCTVAQVKDEIKIMVKIIERFYKALGLWGTGWVRLSVRDYEHPENYIGEPKDWDKCEAILQKVSDELKLNAQKAEGEAALYGPKLDFMFKDILGNDIQIPTVQIDFATPKRFELSYVDENGDKVTPVMVHRAVLGSYERLFALLLEHFAGNFPTWLSPVQVKILPITEKQLKYAHSVVSKLKVENIRVELDERDEPLGAKIRNAQLEKVNYMLIVGEKEEKNKAVSERGRSGKDYGEVKIDKFIKNIKEEIDEKIIN